LLRGFVVVNEILVINNREIKYAYGQTQNYYIPL